MIVVREFGGARESLPSSQFGQATFEYVCIVAFCVIILAVPDSNGNILIVQLANAIKGFYNAFAFAISFSSTITPL